MDEGGLRAREAVCGFHVPLGGWSELPERRAVNMWCLTIHELSAWSSVAGRLTQTEGNRVQLSAKHIVTVGLSDLKWPGLTWFGKFVASAVEPFGNCLLWVTEFGVWPSRENWQLFYRLRESYAERRQLQDAPGHLFLEHEAVDLATFIGLALLFGWDFYVLPDTGYANVFVSHDGFLHIYTDDLNAAGSIKKSLDEAKVEWTVEHAA